MSQSSGEIETRLQAVRSRIRRVQLTRAVMVVVTVALGGLFALMAADYFFAPLPLALRWGMLGAWLLAVLAAAKFGFGPMLKPIGLLQVARWLEVRHPEMEERLSTVLELAHAGGGVSPELLASLARAAEADAGMVDAALEVKSARTTRRWGRPALALAALMLGVLAVWPGEASRLLVRAVAPFADVGNAAAGRFRVKPGNLEVLEGDPVKIEVVSDRQRLDLWMEFENGQKISQAMTKDGQNFSYTLTPARNSFHYRVRAGREESDGFAITVWPMPKIADPRVTLDFPEYTGALPQESALERGVAAVVGTRVTLAGRTNTAVESAWLEVGGKRVVDGTIETSPNGGRLGISWTLAAGESGEAVVMLRHRLGRNIEALRFPVEVLDDRPPEVVLLSPMQRDLRVRPDEVVDMKYEVTEDFAVAKLAVEVDGRGKDRAMLDQVIPARVGTSKPLRFRGDAVVAVGDLRSRFPGTHEIRLRVKAEDARPAATGGPGIGYSEWLTLRIDDGAESLARQELKEQHEGAKQTIEEAIRATREARERMDWHREAINKAALNENARKDLKEAGEKLAGAEEKLDKLAEQMKESVHAAKSDEVQKAAETVAKAREDLENSPLQDQPAERDSKLEQARDEAESAVKQLENVRNAMDREREKIEDLARIQDLAQQQQELARQAAANLADQKPPAWQEPQKRVAEALKQQLREHPQAKAEALKTQLEQTKALAEQAREIARSQAALEEQAKQVSEKSLLESLSAEQTKIATELNGELAEAREARNDLADSLPEATAAAEAARDEIQKGDNRSAADSAKAAAQAINEAAKKDTAGETSLDRAAQAEELRKLAGRQEQIAEAMKALASGKPAEALKDLQAAQAAAARVLAEAMETMPQVDGNGLMDEAKDSAKQGSQQAEAAAKQGQGNQQQEASKQHDHSGQNFEKSADALTRAADEFAKMAAEAAAQAQQPQRAQAPPGALAEAFQQASQAAENPKPAQAAAQAASAAQALAQAAQAARQQMQGRQPGPNGPPGATPGDKPEEGPRLPEADPGVPPDLAKLGISSADWEKIQASLKSGVGAGEGGAVPEEYRELVKGYFESISKKSTKP